jgi:hypothetical protein
MDRAFGTGSPASSFLAGLVGAVALTSVHQLGTRWLPDAPRMDVVGMRAMTAARRSAGLAVPGPRQLYRQTMAGDIASNAIYYSLVGVGPPAGRWWRAAALGMAAGVGALLLPRPMGLGDPPHSDSPRNQVLTVAWYTMGGLAAAATMDALERRAQGHSGDRPPESASVY